MDNLHWDGARTTATEIREASTTAATCTHVPMANTIDSLCMRAEARRCTAIGTDFAQNEGSNPQRVHGRHDIQSRGHGTQDPEVPAVFRKVAETMQYMGEGQCVLHVTNV